MAALVFWGLDYAPFVNPDEGRYVAASYEMAFPFTGASDWVVPHLDTVSRLNKPPLVYWLIGSAFKIFGLSEWSGRLPSAGASLLILAILYVWGTQIDSKRAGAAAALVWATSVLPAALGRTANTDMLLAAAITLTSFALFGIVQDSRPRPRLFGALAGIGMGMALLAKGPVGMALPLLGLILYLIAARRLTNIRKGVWALLFAVGLALVIGLPWYIAVEVRHPGFIHDFVFNENMGRFSGQTDFHGQAPKWYYVPVILVGFFPWTAFLIPSVARFKLSDPDGHSRLFLWIWAGGITLLFSLSNTKLISYVLPAFPPLALLTGLTIAKWEEVPRRMRRTCLSIALLMVVGIVLAITAYPKRDRATNSWIWVPGVLTNDRTVPSELGGSYVVAIVGILSLGGIGLWWIERYASGRRLLIVQGATSVALVFATLSLAGHILRYEDGSSLVKGLAPRLEPGDELVNYACFLPTSIFYAGRPITLFFFKNTSGLDSKELESSALIFQMQDLRSNNLKQWLSQRNNRVFVVSRHALASPPAPNLFLWGRTNDFCLYSTQPRPSDFLLDFVAPNKRR